MEVLRRSSPIGADFCTRLHGMFRRLTTRKETIRKMRTKRLHRRAIRTDGTQSRTETPGTKKALAALVRLRGATQPGRASKGSQHQWESFVQTGKVKWRPDMSFKVTCGQCQESYGVGKGFWLEQCDQLKQKACKNNPRYEADQS